VVILNWNGKDDTLECLLSVYQSAYPNFDVVVVDNNSSDDSVEAIKERFPQVVVCQTGSNLGYAGGNNFGIKWALDQSCDYVFVLNNDTTISPSCISELVEADIISNSGVLGPTNFYFSEPSKIWTIGARRCGLPDPGYTIMGEGDKSDDWPHLLSLDAIVGSAILIRRDVVEKVGVFDEKFFLCWEEFDFCARSIEAGFRCMYVPRAAIFHKVGSSLGESFSPLRTYFNERNKLLWTKKHGSKAEISTVSRESIKSALRILFPPLTLPTGDLPVHKRVIWAAHSWLKTVSSRLAIEKNKATLLAVRDYHLGRFGDCPNVLRKARS
jgi:GT2 family glycosyltransferase